MTTERQSPDGQLDALVVNGPVRRRLRELVRRLVVPLAKEARETGTFPRHVISDLGQEGFIRDRWRGGRHGAICEAVIFAEEVAAADAADLGGGISLHVEAVTSI